MYHGESSRTGFTRIGYHYNLYRRETASAIEESWMWAHTGEVHNGIRGQGNGVQDYTPELLSSHRYPMDRQQDEGVRIKEVSMDPGVESLNSQQEYFKPEYLKFSWSK